MRRCPHGKLILRAALLLSRKNIVGPRPRRRLQPPLLRLHLFLLPLWHPHPLPCLRPLRLLHHLPHPWMRVSEWVRSDVEAKTRQMGRRAKRPSEAKTTTASLLSPNRSSSSCVIPLPRASSVHLFPNAGRTTTCRRSWPRKGPTSIPSAPFLMSLAAADRLTIVDLRVHI